LSTVIVANFVLLPGCAFALALALRLEEPLADGLILLGATSGAPFVPKLTELAKGDLEFAISATVVLTVGTIVYVPLVFPLLVPVQVNPWIVGRPVLLSCSCHLLSGLLPKLPTSAWPQY
jgi:BASS family bile acid:Na+ symporter